MDESSSNVFAATQQHNHTTKNNSWPCFANRWYECCEITLEIELSGVDARTIASSKFEFEIGRVRVAGWARGVDDRDDLQLQLRVRDQDHGYRYTCAGSIDQSWSTNHSRSASIEVVTHTALHHSPQKLSFGHFRRRV